MSYALVAHTFEPGSSINSITTQTAINTTNATLLVVGLTYFSGTSHTVSDLVGGNSNSWTPDAVFQANGGSVEGKLFYCRNPSYVGSGHTFTDTTTGGYPLIMVAAFSGGNTATDRDQADCKLTASGFTALAGTAAVTPTQDNELVLALGCGADQPQTYTIDASFAITDQAPGNGATYFSGALAYLVQTAAAGVNPTWTGTLTGAHVGGIWTFKAAAGAPAGGDGLIAVVSKAFA